jgi:hypothetical protein
VHLIVFTYVYIVSNIPLNKYAIFALPLKEIVVFNQYYPSKVNKILYLLSIHDFKVYDIHLNVIITYFTR